MNEAIEKKVKTATTVGKKERKSFSCCKKYKKRRKKEQNDKVPGVLALRTLKWLLSLVEINKQKGAMKSRKKGRRVMKSISLRTGANGLRCFRVFWFLFVFALSIAAPSP